MAELLRGGPENVSWTVQSDWLAEHHTQEVVEAAYVAVSMAYDPYAEAEDDTPDGKIGEQLRDDLDVLWRALADKDQAVRVLSQAEAKASRQH